MSSYKIIILGSQCSGKSTLIRHLQEHTDYICLDHDEEIKKRNGGAYPKESAYVNTVLLPEIEQHIINLPSVIYTASFFGLGEDGIDNERIKVAKDAGFKFANLIVDMNVLLERNVTRVKENKDDTSHNLNWYQRVYEDMNKLNQFDFTISSNESVEKTAEELLSFLR